MIDILAKTYDAQTKGQGVIFDGFPRTIAQAEALKKMLADRKDDMGMMIELVVDEETLMARLLNRAIAQTAPLAEWFEKEGLRHTFNWKGSKEQMLAEIFEAIDAANK